MADAQRTIDLIFNGVDKTGAAVQSAIGNTNKLASGVQGATQPFADAAVAAVKYEAALLATGAAITAFAVKAAGDFDTGFREIATLIDAPIDSLNEFRKAVLDYGAQSTASLGQVNSAVYAAISAGVDYTQALSVVADAEKLAIAGKGDLNDTLVLLVSSLNAYGLSTEEAGKFSDFLFTTVKQGQTTLPELNASLAQVTTTAAAVGVPFQEVLAAVAALTAAGTPTAQAVTQISSVLSGVLKPSSDASAAAKELGIEFNAQALEAQGLQGFLQSVAAATGGNAEEMTRLFPRIEAVKAVLPLTGKAADDFASALDGMSNSAGATEVAAEKLANSLDNTLGRLGSSFKALRVAIGEPLLDGFGSVADALGAVLGVLQDSFSDGELSQITDFIEGEFGRLTATLSGIAEALPEALSQSDLSGFIGGLEAVRDAVLSLFGGLDLANANDLSRAIEGIADAFGTLSQFSAGVVESFGPLIRLFAELAENAAQGGDAARDLGNRFGELAQVNLAAGAIGNVTSVLGDLALVILGASSAPGLLSGVRNLAPALGALAPALSAVAAAGAAGAAGFGIGTVINDLADKLTGSSLSDRLADFAASLSGLDDEQNTLIQGFQNTGLSADEAAAQIKQLDDEMRELGATSGEVWYNFSTGLAGPLKESVYTLQEYPKVIDDVVTASMRMRDENLRAGGTLSFISNETAKATTALDSFAGASDEVRAKLAIAALETQGAINVAQIEADADRAVAAFEALASAIDSNVTNLGTLYDALGDTNISKLDKLTIKDQIEDANAAQAELNDQLLKQARAETRLAAARADRLARGDAMITINGDGLQPHLEAFMFEILESIQVRVSAEGGEFLLGA